MSYTLVLKPKGDRKAIGKIADVEMVISKFWCFDSLPPGHPVVASSETGQIILYLLSESPESITALGVSLGEGDPISDVFALADAPDLEVDDPQLDMQHNNEDEFRAIYANPKRHFELLREAESRYRANKRAQTDLPPARS